MGTIALLSRIVGIACVLKGLLGLAMPERFYGWRRTQYAAARPPRALFLAPVVLAAIMVLAWSAALDEGRPWGWLFAGAVTAAGVLGLGNLLRWDSHRRRVLAGLDRPGLLRGVDLTLVALGAGLIALTLVHP